MTTRFGSFVRNTGFSAAIAAAVTVSAALVQPAPLLAQGPQSVADIAEGLVDAVVNISTSQTVSGSQGIPMPNLPEGSPFREFFDEFFNRQRGDESRPRRVQSLGSGFVLTSDGLVVTNNHVISDADEITVNFNDGSKLVAELVGRDSKTDLAVLRVKPEKPLTSVNFGNSDDLRVGDWVMAIGNPFGLGGTVTLGIVSARNRDINSGPYDDFIQTDAAINRGNSGGPLFNMDGRVVGINTAIISPSGGSIGIGFAIPTEVARNVIDQLIKYGETRRGWLGVRIQHVTDDIAESLGMGPARGALVGGLMPDGPAEKAGIQSGDVILSFDGRAVPEMRDLPRMVADTPIGKAVDVVVLRKGEEVTVQVVLGRLEESEEEVASSSGTPDEKPEPTTTSLLGLTISELTSELREKFKIKENVDGVVITEVEANSDAAQKRIRAGDVIVGVALEEVSSPEDVTAKIKALKENGRRLALLSLSASDGELRFVAVQID
ncbi:MAG: DegQ family serine endoprotease [Hyphomicrobiales bacterium]|nr:DegQ family serine endoprotease [Hyphomicrobiales bacterium]